MLLIAASVAATVFSPFAHLAHAQNSDKPPAFGLRMSLLGASDIAPLLNAAQVMHTDWVSQTVTWKQLEPAQGEYHWGELDATIMAVQPTGMRVLLGVAGAPDWARPAGSDTTLDGPPADYAAFAEFMGALAARYAGRVGAYEVWPEANLRMNWAAPDGLSPEGYVELLRQASLAIRAADPAALIISGGLAPTGANDGVNAIDDVVYYQRMYSAGVAQYIDALGVRVDGYNNPALDSPESASVATTTYKGHSSFYFRHYEQVRKVMVANGDAGHSLWITSAGWASTPTVVPGMEYAADVTEEQPAVYLVGALAQAQAQTYVGAVFLYNFNFSTGPGATATAAAYSFIRPDWSARPAFLMLAKLRQNALVIDGPTEVAPLTDVHVLPNWSPRLGPLTNP
ncbi:MAG: beta-galactosidase [Chloroflexi bacterium]|nr:beta-galactosidase [Chloroflexota bacterium]